MPAPASAQGGDAPRPAPGGARLRRGLALARFAILWERTWPALWPIPALLAAFLGLALFGVFAALPGWLHLLLLVAFAAAILYFLPRLFRVARPRGDEALRRLERTSGLAHGPLQALTDGIGAGADDPLARSLWEAHRRRLVAALARLGTPLPLPVLPRHDPWGLRFAALILLAVAAAGAWRDAPARLEGAFAPNMDWLIGPAPTLQVWITPPDYTRVAPILLHAATATEPVTVPAGSQLLAELQGGRGGGELDLAGLRRDFTRLDAASQRVEATLTHSGELAVRQGWRRVARWTVTVLADNAPSIAFAGFAAPKMVHS